jgi:hypothetical protein
VGGAMLKLLESAGIDMKYLQPPKWEPFQTELKMVV